MDKAKRHGQIREGRNGLFKERRNWRSFVREG